MNKVELLSPAGNYECFLAAVNSGADAVYLAGNKFGARAYANNFSEEELINALNYAHLLGKKIYLTINTVLKNKEVESLINYLTPYYENGLDGVIVQDIGVVQILNKAFPKLALHASTQMAITDIEGIDLLKNLNIVRAVPARELSLEEIIKIKEKTGIELECFIHGAMCYSYSGKCLFSSFLGDRSGNRGRCAGTCRLPFNNIYPLSMKDMCTLDIIHKLIEGGIDSFKIEGRMKSKEYVAGVTGIYRKYIDLYYNNPKTYNKIINSKEYLEDKKALLNLYTRSGNCEGYYFEHNGRDMITIDKPGYNTADESKMFDLYNKYNLGCKHIVSAFVSITSDKTYMSLFDDEISITVTGSIAQKSENRPLTEESVLKQINKIGDTVFEYDHVDVYIEDNLFLPVSEINKLRREAFSKFENEILSNYKRNSYIKSLKEIQNIEFNDTKTLDNIRNNNFNAYYCNNKYNCVVNNLEQAQVALKYDRVNSISIPFDAFLINSIEGSAEILIKNVSETIHNSNKQFNLCLPYVIRKDFFSRYDYLEKIIKQYTDGIMCDNYEGLNYLSRINYQGEIIGDIHLYALNNIAVNEYSKLGCKKLTLSVELNKGEVSHLLPFNYEAIIYGKIPLMISAQCLTKTLYGCNQAYSQNNIIDRKNVSFSYASRCSECMNIIYNSIPTYISEEEYNQTGLDNLCYRIMLTTENKEESDNILTAIFNGACPDKYTKGHFNRGVE